MTDEDRKYHDNRFAITLAFLVTAVILLGLILIAETRAESAVVDLTMVQVTSERMI